VAPHDDADNLADWASATPDVFSTACAKFSTVQPPCGAGAFACQLTVFHRRSQLGHRVNSAPAIHHSVDEAFALNS
jgi:hypothetical protein